MKLQALRGKYAESSRTTALCRNTVKKRNEEVSKYIEIQTLEQNHENFKSSTKMLPLT
jgi:hypothetical protein